MTRKELESKYQLVEQVTHGDIRTHHAVAGGGTVVMVHFVRPDSPKGRAALEAVEALAGDEAEKVLRTHEVEGEKVLVTRFLMDEGSLEGWLDLDEEQPDPPEEDDEPGEFTKLFKAQQALEDPDPGSAAPPADTDEPAPEETRDDDAPGEFTQLFKAQQAPEDPTPPAAPPADDPPSPPEPGAERPPEPPAIEAPPPADDPADEDESRQTEQEQAGEFTRLFKAIRPGPGEEPEPSAPNAGETPPAESGSPLPPKPSPPPPRPPSAPPPVARRPDKPTEAPEDSTPKKAKGGGSSGSGGSSRPGSFTQEFGRVPRPGEEAGPSRGSGSGDRTADPPPPPPAGPSKSSGTGSGGLSYGNRPHDNAGAGGSVRGAGGSSGDDYLDRLRSAGGPPPPSPPPPGAGKSGTGPAGPGSSPKPPPSGGGGQKGSAGPSEFTRVISAMSSPQRPSTPQPPSAPRPSMPSAPRRPPSGLGSGKGPSTVLLVVGMAVIFVLALAVILVLAFVMNGDEAEGEPGAEGETVEEETSGTSPAPDIQSLVYFLPEFSVGGESGGNV